MSDKNKQFKVSAGLLVGYIIGALIYVLFFEKSFKEAFTDKKLVFLFAGLALTYWITNRQKKKKK